VRLKYREILLPAPAIVGFGLVVTTVLGVAVSYAISAVLGAALAAALFLITAVGTILNTRIIKVSDQIEIGKYRLPLHLIAEASVLTPAQFRTEFKSTQLVLGSNSAHSYLKLEISDPADPYRFWYVATRRPIEFLAAVR
jgi:hypothetical protein